MNKKKINNGIAEFIALLMSVLIFTAFSVPAYAENASTSIERTPSGIPYVQLEQEIDKLVNSYIGTSSPGAAIVVTRDNEMIFSKGYGYANIEKQIPVDPASTVFDYGSINKLFVWTSVIQLAEAGKIKLDQDIRSYFPEEFAEKLRYDKPITMLDIMSHTAGFEQHPLPAFIKSPEGLKSLEETLLSPQPEQIFEPGKVIAYSNFATALAGLVVEKISGERFSDYEMNRILRPLGMNHSSGHPKLADHLDLLDSAAVGYAIATKGKGDFEPRARYYVPLYPAGAMKGTAEDLGKFAIALTSTDTPLFAKPQTLQTMLTQSYTPHQGILSNAHGFWEYNAQPHAVGHSGNTIGFSSNFVVVPEEKLGIVVLTNAEIEQGITSGVIDLLLQDKAKEMLTPSSNLPLSSEVAGHYVLSGNTFSTIQEIMTYLGLIKLEAKGEHDLILTVMGMSGEYKQTSPYVFMLDKTNDPSIHKLAPYLYAEMSDGKVVRLSKGKATDVLPLEPSRSVPVLITYLVIASITIVFFLIAPLVMLIRWFLRKRKGISSSSTAKRLFAAAMVCGTALVLNVMFLLLNVISNQNVTANQMNVEIKMNWILAALAVLLLVMSILKGRQHPQSKGQKIFQTAAAILLILFVFLLADWNFFHLII